MEGNTSESDTAPDRDVLIFRDGRTVEIIGESSDADGPYLDLRHSVPAPGRMAGPHWHPVLSETFNVRSGQVRFRVDKEVRELGADEQVIVRPRQVHEFWTISSDVVFDHRIRPPGRHREMFEVWQRLDAAGKTTGSGIPRNPVDLAMLWELQDGYLAGIPPVLQRLVLRPLARLARARDR